VAKRNPGGARRSRKRRPDPARPRRVSAAPAAPQRSAGVVAASAADARPEPPWHPLPLSELLILVGVVGAVVAWIRGVESNAALLGAGIGAVAIGTIEVSLREHFGGFRAHSGMLAAIPAVVLHSAVVLSLVAVSGSAPRWLNYALLPLDLALVLVCYRLLRSRFAAARLARTALGR